MLPHCETNHLNNEEIRVIIKVIEKIGYEIKGGDEMNRRFEGKVVLITGGGSGIGRATSMGFAQEGATVVVTDIDENKGKEIVEEMRQSGAKGRFIAQDVSDPLTHDNVIKSITDEYGKLDVAFNNAGVAGKLAPLDEYSDEDWSRVMNINLDGVFYGMRAQLKQMLKQGYGAIINNSSILGKVSFDGTPAYTAAKHALIGMTRSAAVDYSKKGIRINAIGPAFIRTPMLEENLEEEMLDSLARLHTIGRLGEAKEVAKAVLFLASDDASFVTGETLMVDGGFTAR